MSTPILFSPRPHKIALSAEDHRQLAAFAHNQSPGDDPHADQHLLASVAREPLSFPSIEERLQSLAGRREISHLLVENLPLDPHLPAAPTNGVRPAGKSWWSESALVQLASACNLRPFGYVEENNGALIHQITPAAGHSREVSSAGTVALGWHSDLAIAREAFRPEFLFLGCLRNDAATPTLIAELDAILLAVRQRSPRLVDTLRQPRFRLESPALLQLWGGKRLVSEPRPLLATVPSGQEIIAANLNTVSATDPEAEQALQAFRAVLPEVTLPIVIRPGQALLFNNQRVLHGRPAIAGGGQRWLQRLYVRTSLEALRQATASAPHKVIFPLSRLLLE